MRAYKFRGSSQIDFSLEIILNQRLFCSEWDKLNDPMEGMFACSYLDDGHDYSKEVADLIKSKHRLRVCSLSTTYDCHLLWSHYAEGFSGMAIEVELPDDSPVIKEILYRGVFAQVALNGDFDAVAAAREVLSSKYSEWSYEKEVRILQSDAIFHLDTPVKRIIVGHRMHPALLEGLKLICEKRDITIDRTEIGDKRIGADRIWPL